MGKHSNPLTNPLHYATKQFFAGPPATHAAARQHLPGYDYVIVGAGAAGCVLASKLSEDKDVSVLLLEAGPPSNTLASRVPAMFSELFHTERDWDYNTVEQPGLAYRRLYWPRGRMIGGSTAMNAMIYHHCSRSDFDEWVSEFGCKGWGYDDIAPYFRRMEKFTPNANRPAINREHRGSDGPWHTGYAHLAEIIDKGFLPACEDVGIPANEDVNTPRGSIGVTRFQTFIDAKGQRSSMSTAFLSLEVMKRPNLYVACNAHVSRVLYDRLTTDVPTVIGVEFLAKRGGDRFQVHAKREVLLCGGAVNTPQLLMLSGIGPADELKKHQIPIVRENDAVGRNLKDHLTATGLVCKARPGTTLDFLKNPIYGLPALARWLLTGTGPLTSNAGEAAAFIRSVDYKSGAADALPPKDHGSGNVGPDLEILCAPVAFVQHGEEPVLDDAPAFVIGAIGLRPQSRGTITLHSSDPFDHPIIDPQYLTDKDNNDIRVLLAGLRLSIKITRAPVLQKYLEPMPVTDDPTSYWWPWKCSDPDSIPDDQLIRFAKSKAFTLYHPVGSARMGPDAQTNVVDLQCRVYGVNGLRVMDASVFPEHVSGHPTAPIGALAYKLSDMIRESRRCK